MENKIEIKGIIKAIENVKDTNYKKITLLMPKRNSWKYEDEVTIEDTYISFFMFNSVILEDKKLHVEDRVTIEGKLIKNSDITGEKTNCEIKIDPEDVFVYQRYKKEDRYGF